MRSVISGLKLDKVLSCRKTIIEDGKLTDIWLDGNDVHILSFLIECRNAFLTKEINGKAFFAVDYTQMAEELAFLGLKRQAFAKRMKKLCLLDLYERVVVDAGAPAMFFETDALAEISNTPIKHRESGDYILQSEIDAIDSVSANIEGYTETRGGYTQVAGGLYADTRGYTQIQGVIPAYKADADAPNVCTNLVRTLEPSNNNQPSKSQEITSVLRPTDNNQLSISQELSDTYPVEKDPKENIPYGDIKEKGKKKAPKGAEMFPILLPILDESTLAAPLKEALRGWLEYKAERKEKYVPTGFKSLLTQAKKNAEKYGDDAVIDLIDECKANGYQGIIWDKLAKLPVKAQQPKLETEHASAKRPDPEIEWRKSKFAPRDYSAGLRAISTSELREYPKNSGKYVPYWMIPGYMQEYPVGSGKYVPYYDLPGYDPEHDENHWW